MTNCIQCDRYLDNWYLTNGVWNCPFCDAEWEEEFEKEEKKDDKSDLPFKKELPPSN